MMAFPQSIDDVTNEWLSEVLDGEERDFNVRFLEGGVLSDGFKVCDIGSDEDLPESLVLKLANQVEDRRALTAANGAYVKEIGFFQDLAPKIPLRTPLIYHLEDDGSADC